MSSTANPRALGIDFGERRIGLAVSDPDGKWALPLTTLVRETDRRAVYQIKEIALRENVDVLILGESRGIDGTDDEAADRVRRFGAKLHKASKLPVGWIDGRGWRGHAWEDSWGHPLAGGSAGRSQSPYPRAKGLEWGPDAPERPGAWTRGPRRVQIPRHPEVPEPRRREGMGPAGSDPGPAAAGPGPGRIS